MGRFPWMIHLSALEHAAFVLGGLLVYVVVTRISKQRRHPSAAIAWTMTIAAVPYLGVPLFLLFGTRKFARARRHAPIAASSGDTDTGAAWARQLLASMEVPAPVRSHSIAFDNDGATARRDLFALIEGARERVDISTYVLGADAFGAAFADLLCRRARAGVRVHLLLDAIGSLWMARPQLRLLRAAGVDVRWFMPLLHNPLRGRTNLRNHRKMVICDGSLMWSGGRNLRGEYFDDAPGSQAWVDLSFIVKGSLALQAQALFARDWRLASGNRDSLPAPAMATLDAPDGARVQLVPSGPDYADDTVYALLLAGAYRANRRILAVTPYFVPDDALVSAWCMACRRGVEMTLVLPRVSNHRLADWARERALRELAGAGARVLLNPAMLHAKLVVIDDDLALCGSVNLDGRSLFLNFELMTAFHGESQIAWLAGWAEKQVAQSAPYDATPPALWRDVCEGVVRSVGFQL